MALWQPGDPWPGDIAGGAAAPSWGSYVRFWLRAAIAGGHTWHLGQHDYDRLDAGNVLGSGSAVSTQTTTDRLWVDLSCDVLDVEIQLGAATSQGIFTKAEAGTLVATIADPEGIYDPLASHGPFSFGGRSRLVPGVPVEAFCEVVDPDTATVSRHLLFTGTADSWQEDWTPRKTERTATLVATDATKIWARFDRPEQPEQGGGETVAQRVERLVTFYAWPGVVESSVSSRTLQATTLAQPGWELLNRALDDELGVVHFTTDGKLRWLSRETWSSFPDPVLVLGCDSIEPPLDVETYDVLIDATPQNADVQMRNSVYAARSGGVEQHVQSATSVQQHGEYDFRRTDLGLNDDAQVAQWASRVVELYSFPQVSLSDVTMLPGIHSRSFELWPLVLDIDLFTDLARIRWSPPDLTDHLVDGELRVGGVTNRISRHAWEVTWQLLPARPLQFSALVFTLGPHARDRLDAGFILG